MGVKEALKVVKCNNQVYNFTLTALRKLHTNSDDNPVVAIDTSIFMNKAITPTDTPRDNFFLVPTSKCSVSEGVVTLSATYALVSHFSEFFKFMISKFEND